MASIANRSRPIIKIAYSEDSHQALYASDAVSGFIFRSSVVYGGYTTGRSSAKNLARAVEILASMERAVAEGRATLVEHDDTAIAALRR